ncbi:hypothetical protein RKD48_005022 [Streptomyces ambofaciens]
MQVAGLLGGQRPARHGPGPVVLQYDLGNMRREELEPDRELLAGLTVVLAAVAVHVLAQPVIGLGEQREPDDRGRPGQQLVQYGVGGALGLHVERTGHPQDGGVELRAVALRHTGRGLDLLVGPGAIEAETAGAAEEFRSVGHHEDRLHTDPESPDLPAALLRHTHPKDGLRPFRGDRTSLVGAVQVRLREDHMDASAGLVRDFVGRVLHELEKLTVAVSALRDTTLAIGVFGHEAGIHGIRLEDTGGLFENGIDHC